MSSIRAQTELAPGVVYTTSYCVGHNNQVIEAPSAG